MVRISKGTRDAILLALCIIALIILIVWPYNAKKHILPLIASDTNVSITDDSLGKKYHIPPCRVFNAGVLPHSLLANTIVNCVSDGKRYPFEQLINPHHSLINFFYASCPACQFEMNFFSTYATAHPNNDNIYLVDVFDSDRIAASFLGKNHTHIPLLSDRNGLIRKAMGAVNTCYPQSYLLTSLGQIIDKKIGSFNSLDELTQFIEHNP